MKIFKDFQDEKIILDEEVKRVIFEKHPEVKDIFDRIQLTLKDPDEVKKSLSSKKAKLYYRYFDDVFDGKYIVVVVKSIEQNFVSTIYVTEKIKRGETLWRR